MAKLIDLDALGIGKCNPDVFNDKGYAKGWNSAIEILQNAPTVDAVPVVRCRECRWHEYEQPGMVYCLATVGGWVSNDWYCKGGERKGGDE